MQIEYNENEDDFDYTYEADYDDVIKAISEIAENLWGVDKYSIQKFISNIGLSDEMFDYFEEQIKEYYKDKALSELENMDEDVEEHERYEYYRDKI